MILIVSVPSLDRVSPIRIPRMFGQFAGPPCVCLFKRRDGLELRVVSIWRNTLPLPLPDNAGASLRGTASSCEGETTIGRIMPRVELDFDNTVFIEAHLSPRPQPNCKSSPLLRCCLHAHSPASATEEHLEQTMNFVKVSKRCRKYLPPFQSASPTPAPTPPSPPPWSSPGTAPSPSAMAPARSGWRPRSRSARRAPW